MQETSNILNLTDLDEAFERFAPEEWKTLPMSMHTTEVFKEDGRTIACKYFMLRCKGKEATDEEIQQHLDNIKANGKPEAWLKKLCTIVIPTWPEGKDPTVQEFFDGNVNPEEMTEQLVLLSYPLMETK